MYSTSDKYEGNWKGDKKHGKGVYVTKEGHRFQEVWEENISKESKETA